MITAESFKKAQTALNEAKGIVVAEMPNARFVFIGANDDYLVFSVVAKRSQVTDQQIKDLKEKTRFQTISELNTSLLYRGEFKMNLWV